VREKERKRRGGFSLPRRVGWDYFFFQKGKDPKLFFIMFGRGTRAIFPSIELRQGVPSLSLQKKKRGRWGNRVPEERIRGGWSIP